MSTRFRLLTTLLVLGCVGVSAQTLSPYAVGGGATATDAKRALRAGQTALRVDAAVKLPSGTVGARGFALAIPTPAGETAVLDLVEASVFPENLRARYPEIRTYRGFARESGRVAAVTSTPAGMKVYVGDGAGEEAFQITPDGRDGALLGPVEEVLPVGVEPVLSCGYDAGAHEDLSRAAPPSPKRGGAKATQVGLRRYVMALACTGEFAERYGGTKASVNAAYAEALNLLNALLVTEAALEFQLHPQNDTLIFLNPGTDPYRNPTDGRSLLGQNAQAINALIDATTYDIGHVFTNACGGGLGGVASGLVCDDAGKSRGVTCHYANIPTIVRNIMTHEVAHQFAVSHTWDNCPGSDGQRAGVGAVEPGSGSTIMSYQGACGASDNISQRPGPQYYHVVSLQQFRDFAVEGAGAGCADVVPVANEAPVVTAPGIDGLTIPARTPFVLEGAATDPDGDEVAYTWEQYDRGSGNPLCEQREDSPLFRSLPPSPTGNVRYFPDYNSVLFDRSSCEEQLPIFTRDLTFRLTARDRNPVGGGTEWVEVGLRVDGDAGPFRITSQATGGTVYAAGDFVPVTWDVAGTDGGDIGVSQVDILLSTDGGRTFGTVLAEATNNDGSEGVNLPTDIEANSARFLVRPVGSVFYAVTEANFSIVIPTEPGFTFSPSASTTFLCLPEERAEIDLFTGSLLGFEGEIALAVEGEVPAGITATLDRASVSAGEDARLTLDLSEFRETREFALDVVATAEGLEPARRTLVFDLVSTDFSDLALSGPDNGETGVELVPTFAFAPSTRADEFVFELSTDPNFGFEKIRVDDPDPNGLTLDFLLETNTVYFWRVVPRNRCIESYDVPINAFSTLAADCRDFVNDAPIDIPANSTRDVVIPVQVSDSGPATDINVPLVDIGFGDVSLLTVSLESPAGTAVELYRRRCTGNNYRAGFDDVAPLPNGYCGGPGDEAVRRPREPLSTFDGEEINGEWQLRVEIATANSAGGQFREFELQFCANIVSAPPTLNLATVPVPTGGFQFLSPEYLDASDPDNGVTELTYIVVEAPSQGHLELRGQRLRVGSRFDQGAILDAGVTYVHDGDAEGTDEMRIVLSDNAGNLIATPTVTFEIRDDAVTGVEELNAFAMTLAPNPAAEVTRVRFGTASQGGALTVTDLQGRALARFPVAAGATGLDVDVADYAPGLYLVSYRGEDGARTLRLARQ